MEKIKNKSIILGITGSISAYKAPLIVRELVKAGAEVHCVMTNSAKEFVTESVLANLSKNHVISDMFDKEMNADGAWHVHLAHKADLMIIAPCSATSLGKIANGICDTALTTLALALPKDVPLVLAPAMDYTMWDNPAVQSNIKLCLRYGYGIIEPEHGELSSGLVGKGRLPEIDTIIKAISKGFEGTLDSSDIIIGGLKDAVDEDKWNADYELDKLKKEHGS